MKKRRLSFWEIWNMSFGFLGIQFGFALQNANVSRIFETLGARVEDIPVLWIAAPITGLIVQPIIGHLSDKTWSRFGRRRPYFMIGALFTTLALFFMPNSPSLWIAAGMLWIMDASINISMEPFRAFVGDNLPSEQRTMGFAMQSFFIGTGAVVASALPYILTNWFGVSNTAPEGMIPLSVKLSFYIGAVVLFLSVLYTVLTTREYAPEELAAFEAERKKTTGIKTVPKAPVTASQFLKKGLIWTFIGMVVNLLIMATPLGRQNGQLYIVGGLLLAFGLILLLSSAITKKSSGSNGMVGIMNDLLHMPKTMGQLAVVQFFSWLSFYAMWIYTTPAITQHVYGTTDSASALYNQGANWVGVLFAVYNGVSALSAFLLPVLARQIGRKATHAIALTLGGVSFISLFFIQDPNILLIPMIGVGFAWGSILSMPYAILTGALPAEKMGTYMGIFNFFIVIPQILAASILGFITSEIFHGRVILTLVLAGCSLILGALSVFWVEDHDDVYRLKNNKFSRMKYFLFPALALLISCGHQSARQKDEGAVKSMHPQWAYNAVIYEVNTRQYTPEGTFNAFSEHLPRLKELGVDILWFMPIQPIGEKDRKGTLGSYYSIKDYTGVNDEFGTMEDFKSVVKRAQDLDMKVILDWVANHTSRDAVWVEAHPEWYVRDSLGELNVMYDWTDIAQLDYKQPEMREAMIKSMMFWIREAGIDGFRCDVAGEIPTDFWVAARDSLTALMPDIFLLAEAEKPELNESAFDAYYAWDFHHRMNMVAQGKENVDSLRASLQRMSKRFSSHAIPMFFTSNHDENSWNGTEFERMGDAARAFAVLTYMLPGMPLIYSGQEVGLNRRLAFFEKDLIDWSDPQGFGNFYRELNSFKKKQTALQAPERDDQMTEIVNDHSGSVWSFKRKNQESEVVCLFNFSKEAVRVTFDEIIPGESTHAFPDSSEVTRSKVWEMNPWEYRIFYK